MIKRTGTVYILISMEQNMKDIGKMINRMAQAKKVGPMVLLMKVIINKEKKAEKVFSSGWMVVYMKVILKIII